MVGSTENKFEWVTPYVTTVITFLLASIATAGSLYLSLGLGLVPCELCWYQRIVMYPLIAITGYSLYTNIRLDGLILLFSSLGILIATYHSYIQLFPPQTAVCSSLCLSVMYTVGPFTIPNLSLIAFTIIFSLTLIRRRILGV